MLHRHGFTQKAEDRGHQVTVAAEGWAAGEARLSDTYFWPMCSSAGTNLIETRRFLAGMRKKS